jgi:hypothetical protein
MMAELKNRVSIEIGKLRGNIKQLWELSKQPSLDRENCKNVIFEIRKSFKILWEIVQEAALDQMKGLSFEGRLLFTIVAGKEPEVFIKEAFKWPTFESEISSVISRLDSEYYKDKEVKDSIARLVESLEAELTKFESRLGLRYGLPKISEFLAIFPQFTDNWAVAVCYLTAMDIMVNKKLEELGLEAGNKFKENYNQLLEKLKERGIEVSELEKLLPSVFWDIRNKVVHTGYSPNQDELETITIYVGKVLTTLIRLK